MQFVMRLAVFSAVAMAALIADAAGPGRRVCRHPGVAPTRQAANY